ncbi:MAG TPA: glycoside hydrolase domain-containing protein [Vicinamibacteria bacterium]|nr:glycoside hydrolase domain-containing protein [Vicinamibacteria bacterium]
MALVALAARGAEPEPPRGIGRWDALAYGHHRAVVRVEAPADAVLAHIPWRRPDRKPDAKEIVIVDAATGARVANVARASVTREAGDLVFQPQTAPGDYYVYFLPFLMTGRSNYPTIDYPKPVDWADTEWLARHSLTREGLASGAWQKLPAARVVEIHSSDAFEAFTPMETIATADETRALLRKHPGEAFLLFPEDRSHPIRMTGDLPKRWADRGAGVPLEVEARPGEFVSLQVGLFAVDRDLEGVTVETGDVRAKDGPILVPGSALHSFGTRGVDWTGRDFRRDLAVAKGGVQALWLGVPVPPSAASGDYEATVTVGARGVPSKAVRLGLRIAGPPLPAGGDDEPERLSRLRWLDSRLAQDDGLVPPYTPVVTKGRTLSVLGRSVELDASGFPRAMTSRFTSDVTSAAGPPRELLAAAVALVAEGSDGARLSWTHDGPRITKQAEGATEWQATSRAGVLTAAVHGRIEFDGTVEYEVALKADEAVDLRDVRLELPLREDAARYAMGLGWKGGARPDRLEWTWDVAKKNQDALWVGDVNAGVQLTLKDDRYDRPLNTNFYLSKPLLLPASWGNGGKGTCRLGTEGGAYLVRCGSGARRMEKGETQRYDFRLTLTPFKPIDTDGQWRTRFYHRYAPLDEIQATGANVVNVHHATPVNPWINYPFLRPAEMKAYVDAAHERGMKVKIYYTVRELSNRAPELWALRSLGHEVLSGGPGGGWAWLQEHVGGDYIGGWFVPEIQDAALVTSGISRWHNYYVEGLDWLARNVDIDGLYLDDVAFDRTTMKRVRKVLDRRRPGALIDLHSANQYNPRDGFASSANLYLEHLPYVDRLWFGEYFDYDAPPDYWLVEMSGVPFGLLGEMLEKGGNPWRGMLFGATSRLPWAGDPRPLWKAWDAFSLEGSRMRGWWVPDTPVRTDRPGVLATTYVKAGKALVAVASWEKEPVDVALAIDWRALGLDPSRARLTAPAIEGFQPQASFAPTDHIRIDPGRGWLLVLDAP